MLSGHWAEGELRFLLTNWVITADELNPEGTLTRTQALNLLIRAYQQYMGYWSFRESEIPYTDVPADSALAEAVRYAIGREVLQPEGEAPVFGGDQQVSRAEFAIWLVRLMKLGRLAQSDLKTEPNFADAAELTPEQRNAAAFLEALGVIPSGGAFRGSEPITQAEAAAMVIRTLEYLR